MSLSNLWWKEKPKVTGYTRLTRGLGHHGSLDDAHGIGSGIDIMSASPSAALLQRGSSTSRRDLSISSLARFYYEDDEYVAEAELPPELAIYPVYEQIMESALPPMDVFPPFKVEGDQIENIIHKMDNRLRKNHTYKTFLEETRNLLTYVLQEIHKRKALQSQLLHREGEMKSIMEFQRRDPRLCKIISLADHWRQNKEQSEEKIQSLLQDIQALTSEIKVLENKMATMQKRQEKLEQQLHKSKNCELEKDHMEEKLLSKEKIAIEIADQVEQLNNTIKTMTTEAAQKENEFKAKLEAAPDRNALKVAALTRELESMTMEKEYRVLEARELHGHVNALLVENTRSSDRIKLLMSSVRSLMAQLKSMEMRHLVVISKNKGLTRQLDANVASFKSTSIDVLSLKTQNAILKKKVQDLASELKTEQARHESVLRNISRLESQVKLLKEELEQKKYLNTNLEKNINEAQLSAHKYESQASTATRNQQREAERVRELQKKMAVSSRHLQVAFRNLSVMCDEIDRTGEKLQVLNSELMRCQEENVRNQSTITHLYQVLDNTENLVRLQVKENDALVISKNRMVDSLKTCCNNKKKLQNEVSRLQNVKTVLEDAALTHRFMLEFVESERDGALRNRKQTEDTVIAVIGLNQWLRGRVVRDSALGPMSTFSPWERLFIHIASQYSHVKLVPG
ncbi:hypothetical protein ElyMa_002132400 [Elysia marginata]|uniref:Uncharacterized protein n=1 Tax=Elysia marginata TaxID=1093978 RepID=A0AAV4FJS6_9GAST|nr:hypothetical protein ElyMa_002132400 [Elysia marginata]